MLDQFTLIYKYRIQFSSDTIIGYINVFTTGTKSDAINLFLKHCRLKNPNVIDAKLISVKKAEGGGGGGAIGTLTIQVNGTEVGSFSGENEIIDINVPTKTSQLNNDSSYVTEEQLRDEFAEELKEQIEQDLAGVIEHKSNKVSVIDDNSTDEQYPSAKAVVDYVNNSILSDEDLEKIIEGNY